MSRHFLAAVLLLPAGVAHAQPYRNGCVVAVSPPAVDVGVAVLKQGGNAVDAAVAVAFAMAVTYPAAGNIGGGGFMMVYPGGGKPPVCVEYREKAPAAVNKDTFVKDTDPYTHRAVGVPGTVRGLALAHKTFGKLPWKDVVTPAVALATEGFLLEASLAGSLNSIVVEADRFAELKRCLGKNGRPDWQAGDRFVQPDLGKTLRLIAERGPDAFYTGELANLLADEMKRGGGFITTADLANYQANVRAPIHGTYRGYDVYGPPPPSSGGICLIQMLNMLEPYDLTKDGRWSPRTVHRIAETMKRSYCDRARHLGDADFVTIPPHLTSKEYARKLADGINLERATPSATLAPEIDIRPEGDSTTHFSVIDGDGMAVANTYTLERSYGSRVVVQGAGYLLNNEMIDFNWQPGVTTRDGKIGTPANQIAAGKRMLSSQTPTILAKDGKAVLVTGSPGSRTIINTVLNVVVNVVDFGMDARAAVDAPRMHHQWFPDELRLESGPQTRDLSKSLQGMGHRVRISRQGDAHTIQVDPKTGLFHPAEDRRISGKAGGW